MASFGAKYPTFCPVAEEPEGALPVYKGDPVRIGRLIKADLTVNLASGKIYGDDELAESVDEFSSGSIAMETDDMEDPVAAVVYGCKVEGKTVRYNVNDDPPPGGLVYIKKLMRRKRVLYKGFYYPLVKAALGNDTAQTKTDSITFGTNNTTFTVFTCKSGDWRITEEFPTEPEAIAWIKKKLAGREKAAAPTAQPPAGAVASGATVSLTSSTPDAVIHYTTDGEEPTEDSPAYSAPIEITAETTIKAIAAAEGFIASDVLEARYTLTE